MLMKQAINIMQNMLISLPQKTNGLTACQPYHQKESIKNMITTRIATITALAVSMLYSVPAIAGPPLLTNDAGVVDVGNVEIELNFMHAYDKEKQGGERVKRQAHEGEVKVTTGLYENLDAAIAVPYTFMERERVDGALEGKAEGFGDMTLEFRYKLEDVGGIDFAINPFVTMPTGKYSAGLSSDRWHPGLKLIATKEFEDGKYALHANIGYEHRSYKDADDKAELRRNFFSASVAGEAEVLDSFFWVADFGLETTEIKKGYGSTTMPVYGLTGFRYEINDLIDVNAGVKVGLTKPEDDVALVYGLMLKF